MPLTDHLMHSVLGLRLHEHPPKVDEQDTECLLSCLSQEDPESGLQIREKTQTTMRTVAPQRHTHGNNDVVHIPFRCNMFQSLDCLLITDNIVQLCTVGQVCVKLSEGVSSRNDTSSSQHSPAAVGTSPQMAAPQ